MFLMECAPSKSRDISNSRDSDGCRGRPLQGVPFVHNCDLKPGRNVGRFDIYFFLEIEKTAMSGEDAPPSP